MVLQQGMETPIWGWADAGENVSVICGEAKLSATSGVGEVDGETPGHDTGRSDRDHHRGEKHDRVLKDVLVGRSLICSGQSNMQWTMTYTKDAKAVIESANNPKIRLFTVER